MRYHLLRDLAKPVWAYPLLTRIGTSCCILPREQDTNVIPTENMASIFNNWQMYLLLDPQIYPTDMPILILTEMI